MLKNKEEQLKNKIKNIIKEVGYDHSTKQDIMDEFKSRNLDALRAAWVFSENLDLDTLTDSEDDIRFLFLFSFASKQSIKRKKYGCIK